MACFSAGVALFIVSGELRAVRRAAAARWSCSPGPAARPGSRRWGGQVDDRERPLGVDLAQERADGLAGGVLDRGRLDRFSAPRAVRNVANTYSAISESTGNKTSRKIRVRMDRRRNPMAQASKCECERTCDAYSYEGDSETPPRLASVAG